MKMRLINLIKRAAVVVLFAPAVALSADAVLKLDKAPVSADPVALQNGARTFINYCMSCHSASYMRYNMLEQIGFTKEEIIELIPTGAAIGDLMTIAMRPAEGKTWFGVRPPDLTLVARLRASEFGSGADWLYTYLRTFYRDSERPTGWNNPVFENVGMPHALWQLQGEQIAHKTKVDGVTHIDKIELKKPGSLSADEYDKTIADLVSFLVWMGEPVAHKRQVIGIWVLIALLGLFVLTYALKKNYWKDVH